MEINIVERGTRETCLGPALQLKIFADGYPPLGWREVWEAFADAYPDKWAMQVFPPRGKLIDGKAVYHLFVFDSEPQGMNLKPY